MVYVSLYAKRSEGMIQGNLPLFKKQNNKNKQTPP